MGEIGQILLPLLLCGSLLVSSGYFILLDSRKK